MAEQKGKQAGDKPLEAADAPAQPRTIGLGARLVPASDSDQPRVANYTRCGLKRPS